MKLYLKLIILMPIAFVLFSQSCSMSSSSKSVNDDTAGIDTNILLSSTIEVFYTIPSPIDAAKLINDAGVKFDEKILNPVKNVPYYETSQSMALNLGIYCADLSFTSFYDQKQITMDYLGAIKTIADGLGLINLLKHEDIIKLEDNIYNKDSIKVLVENIFLTSGQFLNDNNRPQVALMVEVGGWIEGIYIAMQLAKQSGHINKELVDRISEQRNSLILVIKSLENFSEIEQINEVLIDMKKLKSIYDKMVVPADDNSNKKNVLTSENNSTANITPEIFLSLYHEINRIRNSYTQ